MSPRSQPSQHKEFPRSTQVRSKRKFRRQTRSRILDLLHPWRNQQHQHQVGSQLARRQTLTTKKKRRLIQYQLRRSITQICSKMIKQNQCLSELFNLLNQPLMGKVIIVISRTNWKWCWREDQEALHQQSSHKCRKLSIGVQAKWSQLLKKR